MSTTSPEGRTLRDRALALLGSEDWSACISLLQQARHHAVRAAQPSPDQAASKPQRSASSFNTPFACSPSSPPPSADELHLCRGSSRDITELPVSNWLCSREALQVLVIANIMHSTQSCDWHAVLRLPSQSQPAVCLHSSANATSHNSTGSLDGTSGHAPASLPGHCTTTSAATVRQAFRRTAALVHPDKCKLVHAAHAFRSACCALEQLLVAAQEEQQGGSTGSSQQAPGDGLQRSWEGGMEEKEGEERSGSCDAEYVWWEPWDDPPHRPAHLSGSGVERGGAPAAGSHGTTTGRSVAEGGVGVEQRVRQSAMAGGWLHAGLLSSIPREEETVEDVHLWQMDIEALKAEVSARQNNVFTLGGSYDTAQTLAGASAQFESTLLPVYQRQRRLRYARSVLSDRLAGRGQPPAVQHVLKRGSPGECRTSDTPHKHPRRAEDA
ncbi:hypothetical protein V8C86DRAFT_2571909 [Haematococcus lacustris]